MEADSTLLLNYGLDVLAVTHEGSLVPDLNCSYEHAGGKYRFQTPAEVFVRTA